MTFRGYGKGEKDKLRPNIPAIREVSERDVFQLGYVLPTKVCILAPGFNGTGHHHKIGNRFTISVNYGVTVPVHTDLWLVGDWWICAKDWWPRVDVGYHGRRIFVHGLAERCEVWDEKHDLTFKLVKRDEITQGFHIEHPQKFRPDETSVGIAIDFACRFGARDINLIGVDMVGEMYWDSKVSTCTQCDRTDGVWPFRDLLMDVIQYYQSEGVKIRSYSPTALDVKTG